MIKDSLEQRVKNHKELVRKGRSIEQDIEVTDNNMVQTCYDSGVQTVDGTKKVE